jgi:hypothetical protein
MTPDEVTSATLAFWFSADQLGGLSDGDVIGTPLVDLSAAGNDGTQADANLRPLYRADVSGHPAMEFGRSIVGTFTPSKYVLPDLGLTLGAEMFAVVQLNADPPPTDNKTGPIIGDNSASINANAFPYTDGVVYEGFYSTVRKTTVDPTPSMATFRIVNLISKDGEWSFNIDGSSVYTTATNTFHNPAAANLGADDRVSSGLHGHIKEIFLFDDRLDSGDRTAMVAYLTAKYFAAAYETAQDGPWDDTATWVGGVVPTGDVQVTINSGHDVTIETDVVLGGSPSSQSAALTINGSLTITTGWSLTMKASVSVAASGLLQVGEAGGGAELYFDSSLAGSPTNYRVNGGGAFTVLGTAAAKSVVESDVDGDNAYFETLDYDLTHANVTRIGTAAIPAFSQGATGSTVEFQNCLLLECGTMFEWFSLGNSDAYSLVDCTCRASLGTVGLQMLSNSATILPTRNIHGCVFDKQLALSSAGLSLKWNVLLAAWSNADVGLVTSPMVANENNIVRINGEGNLVDGISRLGAWSGNVQVSDGNTLHATTGTYTNGTREIVFNPHWNDPGLGGDPISYVTDCIFDDFGSTGGGDIELHHPSPITTRWERCISVYQGGGGSASTFFTVAATADDEENPPRHEMIHCTHMLCLHTEAQAGAIACGELIAGYADQVAMKSSIAWSPISLVSGTNTGHKIGSWSGAGSVATDIALPANCDYNCGFNTNTSGPAGVGYNVNVTSGTCGVNDVDEDPDFVNSEANFATWAASVAGLGVPSTDAEFMAAQAIGLHKLRLKNEPLHADYDADFLGASTDPLDPYKTYMRAAFTPQNGNLFTAGHDGGTIGAVEVAVASSDLSFLSPFGNSWLCPVPSLPW